MSEQTVVDFEIPTEFLNCSVSVSFNIPLAVKGGLGGSNIQFPGIVGKLVRVMRGALLLETTDNNGVAGLAVVPMVQIQGITCGKPSKSALIS